MQNKFKMSEMTEERRGRSDNESHIYVLLVHSRYSAPDATEDNKLIT